MKLTYYLCALSLCLYGCLFGSAVPLAAQTPPAPALHGTISDPSGALVPGALVQLRGPGGEQRKTTDSNGQYIFPALRPGKYNVRVIAKGFSPSGKQDFEIDGPATLDAQLIIESETQVVNVEDEANKVTADPTNNAGALVLGEKELSALSDDPDELSQQLQAMAGPGAGPSGGQIYIDGFTGGNLPNKSSIREVRINSNPYSPEYERPGFGRIEIFTKPGTDTIRGQLFGQYNKEALNSRSALLTQSQRPPYRQDMFGANLTGPIKKQKASFGFDAMRRSTTENAFILATDLDANLNPQNINQTILTPQTMTNISPRIDYAINPTNSLTVRYQNTRLDYEKQGVGSFNLASKGYNQTSSENTLQATETNVVSPRFINEARFQYMRSNSAMMGDNTIPSLTVQGAFAGGGAQVGNSGSILNRLELSNNSTFTYKTHTIKWGGRARQSYDDNTSVSNFGGSYSFFGGEGPQLDTNNNPIAGTSIQLTALEVYRRTLLFQKAGLSDAEIRQLGGGVAQFSLSAGAPMTSVKQFDMGLFVNDDWRARPNLTVSYGLRYEDQTNLSDHKDFSPRIGIAWGIDSKGGKPGKTVLRAGFGIFFDRLADSATLSALRYNGVTQQSYLILDPAFFPSIPSLASLTSARLPQNLQYLDNNFVAPRNYQASIGADRQINKYARISVNYINGRGTHLLRSRDINAPILNVSGSAFPYGDSQFRNLTESTGFSRTSMIQMAPSVNYKKIFLFGFYMLSYGKSDAEGTPADPYNLRAEWGPSSFSDVRHRAVMGTMLPLPLKFSVSPFIMVSSGAPYNITTGRDSNGDGIAAERPALMAGVSQSACSGSSLIYESAFGCFNLNPAPGTPTISRNFARGPATANVNLRLSRTWTFGGKGESGPGFGGMMGGPGGGPGGGGGRPGGGGPPGGMMVPMGGGPGMMGGAGGGRRYNLTFGVNASNAINHTNYAAPSGDLSSSYFGVYRSLASGFGPMGGGGATFNRKIDVSLRFSF